MRNVPDRQDLCKARRVYFESPCTDPLVKAPLSVCIIRGGPDYTTYKMAEAYHWQQAISQYSKELARAVGPHNMDTLFSTCLLMTVNALVLDEYNPRTSFVFSDDPKALNWLTLQGGLRHLLGLTRPWLCISMWWEAFMASHHETEAFGRPARRSAPGAG